MKIIEANQCFFTVHSVKSVLYKENKEKDCWEISVIFSDSNDVKIYEKTEEDCIRKFKEILIAVKYCTEDE